MRTPDAKTFFLLGTEVVELLLMVSLNESCEAMSSSVKISPLILWETQLSGDILSDINTWGVSALELVPAKVAAVVIGEWSEISGGIPCGMDHPISDPKNGEFGLSSSKTFWQTDFVTDARLADVFKSLLSSCWHSCLWPCLQWTIWHFPELQIVVRH